MCIRDRDGSVTEEALKAEEVKEMVHIAHEEGFHVMAHTNGARAVLEAALAGVDSIEHGNYVDEEAMWAMKENGTVWVPTITVVKNMIGCGRFSDAVLEKIWETDVYKRQTDKFVKEIEKAVEEKSKEILTV